MKNKFLRNTATFALLASFLLTYFMDLTGLELHQLLGIFAAFILLIHIITHWKWITNTTGKFFRKISSRLRLYYLLDFLILAGIFMITVSGVLISTWFAIDPALYLPLRSIHIVTSVITLPLLVLKLGLHWKYFVSTLKKKILQKKPAAPAANGTQLKQKGTLYTRRDALKTIGAFSAVGLMGMYTSVKALGLFEEEALPDPQIRTAKSEPQATMPEAVPQIESAGEAPMMESSDSQKRNRRRGSAVQDAASENEGVEQQPETYPEAQPTPVPQLPSGPEPVPAETCVVRCPEGCAYPGKCRRYIDENSNQLCDLGECLAV